MLSEERHRKIVEYLQQHGTLRVAGLMERLGVSRETIRRDLQELEQQGVLRKVHGGAVLERTGVEPTFSIRQTTSATEKQAIGQEAAKLVEEGDTLFLDLGTTTLEVAKHLRDKGRITVITNSVQAALQLVEEENITLYLLGGKLRSGDLSMSGHLARMATEEFYVDKAIIGIAGISIENGLSDFHVEEAEVRRLMMKQAKSTILVADHSKFGVNAFIKVAPIEQVDYLVTDHVTNPQLLSRIEHFGVEVIRVPAASPDKQDNVMSITELNRQG